MEYNTDQNGSISSLAMDEKDNVTQFPFEDPNLHYHYARSIQTYFLPAICVVGIVSNCLAVKTFLHRSLRNYSCSVYLIVKCVSDTLFLLNLFGIYIGGSFNYNLHTVKSACKVVIFVAYISGFVSVWTVIFVTFENFIRIRFPFDVKKYCTTRKANISICVLIILSFGIYNFSLWISGDQCEPMLEYNVLTQVFIYIDTLITLILPSISLAILILIIITKLLAAQRKEVHNQPEVSTRLTNTRKSKSKIAVVTKMLLSVSLSFFLLTVTSHVVRFKFFVTGQLQLSDTEAAVQIIAQLFYYSSMSINLFIFLSFGDNFRKVFKSIFLRKIRDNFNFSETERMKNKESLCYEDKAVEVTERDISTYKLDQATNL